MFYKVLCISTAVLTVLFTNPVQSQTQEDAPKQLELEPVLVSNLKDPDAFDVTRSMSNIRIFEGIPDKDRSLIRLSFHAFMRNGDPLPTGVHMSLATAEGDRPLVVLPSGEVLLPKLALEEAVGAEFVANTRKGTLRITYFVQPKLVTPMTMGYLRQSLVQARNAYKLLYGPLTAWSIPVFTCAGGHYGTPSTISVRASSLDGKVVWQSPQGIKVEVPVNDAIFTDDFVVDWGTPAPYRIGGCVPSRQQ